jgi:hypothetical protein
LIALIIDAQHPNPEGFDAAASTRGRLRRCEAAIKTYAFFRTCPGREAVKLPIISPEHASRRSGWSRPVGWGHAPGFACRASRASRPDTFTLHDV